MKIIFRTPINGIELQFTSGGINLAPQHNLNDPAILAAYQFGQALHPIILDAHKKKGLLYPLEEKDMVRFLPVSYQSLATEILKQACNLFVDRNFNQVGYVYLIRNEQGQYKIGMTRRLEDRRKTFNVKLPFEIEFIVLIEAFNPDREEKRWHQHFADKHINGEWYALDDYDVAYMKQFDTRSREPLQFVPPEIDPFRRVMGGK